MTSLVAAKKVTEDGLFDLGGSRIVVAVPHELAARTHALIGFSEGERMARPGLGADFKDGKSASEAVHTTCFSCHEPAKDRDYVFTRYAR